MISRLSCVTSFGQATHVAVGIEKSGAGNQVGRPGIGRGGYHGPTSLGKDDSEGPRPGCIPIAPDFHIATDFTPISSERADCTRGFTAEVR